MVSFLKVSALVVGLIGILLVYNDVYVSQKELAKLEAWAEENKIDVGGNKVSSKPFKIEYDEKEWKLLVEKLRYSRFFSPLDEKHMPRTEYGFDPEYAKELAEYWLREFSWKDQVNYLNRYPQFKFEVDGVTVHYVRVVTNPSPDRKPINLLMVDGWPGAFFGFYKVIDYLIENEKDKSYDIIVPSIPGFGYSSPLNRPIDPTDTALLFDALMRFSHGENVQYYVHGEDWGSIVSTFMAKLFPGRIRGIHVTMPGYPKFTNPAFLYYSILGHFAPSWVLTQEELDNGFQFSLGSVLSILIRKTGYLHLQATKPDTLGHGLTDSPVGLMAYILEKYAFGSFPVNKVVGTKDGNLNAYNKDDLLRIVTYYWMTNTITSSCRFYKAAFAAQASEWPKTDISYYKISERVPVAVQYFQYEVNNVPYNLLNKMYLNLKRFNIVKNGGHFASFENPVKTAQDFTDFVKSIY